MPRPSPEVRTQIMSESIIDRGNIVFAWNPVREVYRRTYSGTVTPGFRGIKSRNLPINPHSVNFVRRDWGTYYSRSFRFNKYTGVVEADVIINGQSNMGFTSAEWDEDSIARLFTEANTKALLNVKDMKVNLAQAFAERHQTSRMIGSTATRLANAFRALRKFNFHGCARALGVGLSKRKVRRLERNAYRYRNDGLTFAANSWLEYKFGWLPLLSDVRGAAEALAKYHNSDSSICRASGSAQWKKKKFYFSGTSVKLSRSLEMTFDLKYVYRFRTKAGLFENAPSLGLSDPLLLAWELLPYSFVVDWFLPVGDYLSSLTATQNVEFVDGYWAAKKHFKGSASETSFAPSGPDGPTDIASYIYYQNNAIEEFDYVRTPLYAFTGPSLPSIKSPFSFSHAITGIALLVQAFKR